MRRGPVEAAGTVDAQNAPTAPWKTTEQVFHSSHKASSTLWLRNNTENVNLSTKPGQAQNMCCCAVVFYVLCFCVRV
jgi:hypothetical protein